MKLAIIGGTGALKLFRKGRNTSITTPFGPPSERPSALDVAGREIWFLARHGDPHRVPPHKVNYRANIHALRTLGVDSVLALNAVGGLNTNFAAGTLLAPDQIIDYTWGRAHTFSDGGSAPLRHVDFSWPYHGPLRERLLAAAGRAGETVVDGGCHAVTQGPRLETAAEVQRLAADGSDVVGMTAMPEAALAREAGLDYASLCMVANLGAGLTDEPITEDEIHAVLEKTMKQVRSIIERLAEDIELPEL